MAAESEKFCLGSQSTADFLKYLRELKVHIQVNGGSLNCSAPKGVLTPGLKDELIRRKPEILAMCAEADPSSSAIARVPRTGTLPLSPAQRRIWFLQRYDPESPAYNIVVAVRFRGPLDGTVLAQAFHSVLDRHEALRTGFRDRDGVPEATAEEHLDWEPEVVDFAESDDEAFDARVRRFAIEGARQPFDLARPPLIRVAVARAHANHHALIMVVHHIVADGWSIGVMVKDCLDAYKQRLAVESVRMEEPTIQFADYVAWRTQEAISSDAQARLQKWTEHLKGAVGAVELPSDRPRPAIARYKGARSECPIPLELSTAVKEYARREGATLFLVLLAAFKALLYRYTGQDDLVVGSATAGRDRPEVEPLVGLFINTLVLRTSVDGALSGTELVHRVRDTVLNASARGDVPFDALVAALPIDRDLSHPPLVQLMFTLQNFPLPTVDLPGVTAEPIRVDQGTARLDITVEAFDFQDNLQLDFEYNTDLFDRSTIERFQRHYVRLLAALVAEPTRRIDSLPLLTDAELADLGERACSTEGAYHRDSRLDELVDSALLGHPERVAVRCEGNTYTARQVADRSAQIAAALQERGVGRGDVVAVCLDRSADMPVALLGVAKAGAAYVPLDPIYPADRLAYMLEDSGARVIVTSRSVGERLPESRLPVLWLDEDFRSRPTAALKPTGAAADDLAYILYTSGSTGKPKGVEITHRSLVNFLESMQKRPGLTEGDRLVAVTTLCFDIAGLEMYLPLLAGAELIVAPRAAAADPSKLRTLLDSSRATVMQATPATWRMMLDSGWKGTEGFRVFCGGEALTRDLADRLLAGGAELWNLYGPTETTVWSTVEQILPDGGPITVGTPVANTTVYVLDGNQQPLPAGVTGELYIGGDGVARGYHNRPDLTMRAFVPNPFQAGSRLYRTGDLARWRSDGRLELLGRTDRQVKIRGYRVELGEIEVALRQLPDVAQAVVVPNGSGPDVRLVGYVIPTTGTHLDATDARTALAGTLPDYMVPAFVIELSTFPLTPNGKVDKKALPAPSGQQASASNGAPPAGRIERDVADIWRSLLQIDRVARHDNFFDVGGHSLLVVQMQNRLKSKFGRDIALVEIFQRPTVSGIASLLQADEVGAAR